MFSPSGKTRPKELRLNLAYGQVVNTGMLIAVMKTMARTFSFQLTINGASSAKETDKGIEFKVDGGNGSGLHAWKLVSGGGKVTVHGGSCGSATIDTTEFETTDDRFYLKIRFNRSISTDGSFLRGASLTSVELLSGPSIPASSGDYHYLQIGRVEDGKVTAQNFTYSFGVGLCDAGSGDGEGELKY